MADNKYIPWYDSYYDRLAKLSDQEVGRLVRALMIYHRTGEAQELTGRESVAYDFIVVDIDQAEEALNEREKDFRVARKEAGRLGGLAKASKYSKSKQNVANVANVASATVPAPPLVPPCPSPSSSPPHPPISYPSPKDWFIKLEHHDFQLRDDGSRVYVVENKAFRSGKDGGIGAQVPLSSVKEWERLSEREEIEGLEKPLFAYFKPPGGNRIEPSSPMGASVYGGSTVGLIRQADLMWEKLFWEYASGERKVLLDRGAVGAGQVKDRLFEYGTFSQPDFFQFLNPEIRDDPFYRGFQRILQRIEFNVGLAFGAISDPQSAVERTATEILAAKQRQFVTGKGIQKRAQAVLDDLIYAMDAWCDLARLAPAGEYSVEYNWGDGVLDDPDTRRQDMAMDVQRVNNSLMSRKRFIMKWEGVDEEKALKIISEIDDVEEIVTEPEEEIE